ncbi:MAG: ankyrin repeat domain-containing protein [Alphaproteobacteria bacterium]
MVKEENPSELSPDDYLFQLNAALEKGNQRRISNIITLGKRLPEQSYDNSPIVKLIENSKIANKLEILIKLIEKGTNLKVKDETGRNLIHNLIYQITLTQDQSKKAIQEMYNMVDTILTYGETLLDDMDSTSMDPISKAVELGDVRLAEVLFKHGANPNSLLWNEEGHSLLSEAIDQDNKEMIDLLMKQENLVVDPKVATKMFSSYRQDRTLMNNFRTIYNKTEEQAKEEFLRNILLKDEIQELKPKLLKTYGSNTLKKILDSNKDKLTTESYKLVEKFYDINIHDGKKLFGLIEKYPTEAVNIIKQGIWLNSQEKDSNNTALINAVIAQNNSSVKEPIEAGANVNIDSSYGVRALHYAVEKGNTEIVKELIKAGADLNIKDKYGKTAVHICCTSK